MAIVLKTISDSKEAQADLAKLRGSVDNIQTSVDKITSSFSNLAKVITAGFAGVAAFQAITRYSDELTNLETKIRLATNSQAEFGFALNSVRRIANSTRSDLSSVASLYQKLSRAGQDFGASQADVAKATNLISKAIATSGSGAQEANAAIIQLGQALASGRLAGDELRSILENAPPLASAIAKGLGVSIGKLRELGEAGQLSSVKVFQAILKQQSEIEKSFGKVKITYGQALQNLRTSFVILFDEVTKAITGSTGSFAEAINKLANSIFRFAINFRITLLSARTELALFITRFVLSFYNLWDVLEETGTKAKESARTFYEAWKPVLYSFSQQVIEFSKDLLVAGTAISISLVESFRKSDLGSKIIESFTTAFNKVKNFIVTSFNSIYNSIPKIDINKFLPGLNTAIQYIQNWAQQAERWFFWLYDKVVGRSWIPDLVTKVTEWLSKLNTKPTSIVASFVDKLNLSFKGIKITGPFVAGLLAIKKFKSELTGLLGILGIAGAALAGFGLLKSGTLNIKSENKDNTSILTKSLEWLKKIQKETKESFDKSAVGRTLKQVLGMPDRTPGQIFGESIDTRPNAQVGRGPYRMYGREERGFGHDIINAFPRDLQVPVIAGLTGIMALAIMKAFEAGTTRTVILSVLTSAAAIFAARTVDPKLINEAFGKAAFGFLNILEKGITAIFSGNVLKDPVGVLSLIAKTAILFERGREALGRAAIAIGTAPTSLAQASASVFERALLNRDVRRNNAVLADLPNRLNAAFANNQREARQTIRDLARLRDASGNLIGMARAQAVLQTRDFGAFGTQASAIQAARAAQAQQDFQTAANNLNRLPVLQGRLQTSIQESQRRSDEISQALQQQRDAFRQGFANISAGAGGILGGLAGFQIGTEIARGMTTSPEWVRVGTAIAISFAGQAIGAGIGNTLAIGLLAAVGRIGSLIASAFSLAAAGIGTLIASPILLAIAAAAAAAALIFNWDSIKSAAITVADFLANVWETRIIPKLEIWSKNLEEVLNKEGKKVLSGQLGGFETTSVVAGSVTAALTAVVAYFTRNITGLANVFASAGPQFSILLSSLRNYISTGTLYLNQFVFQQIPFFFNQFISFLSKFDFGKAIAFILQDIVRQLTNIWNSLRTAFATLGAGIASAIPDFIKNIFSAMRANLRGPAIVAAASAAIAGVYTLIKEVLDKFRDQQPQIPVGTGPGQIPGAAPGQVAPPVNRASGGWIRGSGTATSDSIPAMLSNGEFVVNAKDAKKNWDILTAINSGVRVSKFKDGTKKTNQKEFGELIEQGFASDAFVENLNNSIKTTDLNYLQNLQYYKEKKLQYEATVDPALGFFDFRIPKIIAPYPIGAELKRIAPNQKLLKDSAIFSYATTLHEQGHAWSLGTQIEKLINNKNQNKVSELLLTWERANSLKGKLVSAAIPALSEVVIPEEKIASDFANSRSILKGKDQAKFSNFLLALFGTYTDYLKYTLKDVLQENFKKDILSKNSKINSLTLTQEYGLILSEIQKDYKGNLKIFENYLEKQSLQEVSKLVKIADAGEYKLKLLNSQDSIYNQKDNIQSSGFAKYLLDSLIEELKRGGRAPLPVEKASGGWVRGPGTSTSDSIPAMLSNGEFVVNASDAAKNWDILTAINSGKDVRRFNNGTQDFIAKAYSDPTRNKDVIAPALDSFVDKFTSVLENFFEKLKKTDLFKKELPKVPALETKREGALISLLNTSKDFDKVIGGISDNLRTAGFDKLNVQSLTKLAKESPEEFRKIAELLDNSSELLSENVGQNKKLGVFLRNQNKLIAEANFQEISNILASRRIAEIPSKFKPQAGKTTDVTFGEQLTYINKAFPELNLTVKDLLSISDDVREEIFESSIIIARNTAELDKIPVGTVEGGVTPQKALERRQKIEAQRIEFLQKGRLAIRPFRLPFEDVKIAFEEIGQSISEETFNLFDDVAKNLISDLLPKIKEVQRFAKKVDIPDDFRTEAQKQIQEYLEKLKKIIDESSQKALKDFEKYRKELQLPDIDLSKRSFTLLTDIERVIINEYAGEIKQREGALEKVSEIQRFRLQSEIDEFYKLISDIISTKSKGFKTKAEEAGLAFSSSIQESITNSIADVLKGKKTGKEAWRGILDTFTSSVIDTFIKGLMSPLTGEKGLLTTTFQGLGAGLFGTGESLLTKGSNFLFGTPASKTEDGNQIPIKGFIDKFTEGFKAIDFKGLWTKFTDSFKDIDFSGMWDLFKKGFKFVLDFLGFAQGGYVSGPGTPTSDSIPAMLSNGEFVINAKATKDNIKLLTAINNGSFRKFAEGGLVSTALVATPVMADMTKVGSVANESQQVININITGDISRQTRAQIYEMLPSIAEGVNMHNREKGYKR